MALFAFADTPISRQLLTPSLSYSASSPERTGTRSCMTAWCVNLTIGGATNLVAPSIEHFIFE